jgi:hypothetical protein
VILVDTSIWIDHLRHHEPVLVTRLERREILVHPWVIGARALGNLRNREEVLHLLGAMPQSPVIDHGEVLAFIAGNTLHGVRIGLVDAHLPASAHAISETLPWTRDRRLGDVAERLGLRFDDAPDASQPRT